MDEKVIAEAEFQITKKDVKEWISSVGKLFYKLIFWLIAICATIIVVINCLMKNYLNYTNWIAIICLAIGFLFRFGIPSYISSVRYKQFLSMNNGSSTRKIVFFENHLEIMCDKNMVTTLNYSQVKSFKETKNLYIIVFENKIHTFMKKDSFTLGSFEEVKNNITR